MTESPPKHTIQIPLIYLRSELLTACLPGNEMVYPFGLVVGDLQLYGNKRPRLESPGNVSYTVDIYARIERPHRNPYKIHNGYVNQL